MDKQYPDWIQNWIDAGFDPDGTICNVKLIPSSGSWSVKVSMPDGSEFRNFICPPYALTSFRTTKKQAAITDCPNSKMA